MIRVLLVDDHDVVRQGTQLVLAQGLKGATFGMAVSAEEGMSALKARGWDLLVLDINLPDRSGLEMLEDVKKRWKDLPVVVLSAYPEEGFAVRCLRAGASAYVTKSMASHELLAAARKALEGGKYVTPLLAERLAAFLDGSAPGAPHDTLSRRELQVLRLVATGLSTKEIAEKLGLSDRTISTFRTRISSKLGLNTNVELTRYALQHGLVQ